MIKKESRALKIFLAGKFTMLKKPASRQKNPKVFLHFWIFGWEILIRKN